jgi:hypothetical protein
MLNLILVLQICIKMLNKMQIYGKDKENNFNIKLIN